MKKLFTIIACLAMTMSTYADWTVKVGGQDYPMTLVEGTSPETYTASVELEPGNYYATITDGEKTSNSSSTSFTLTETQTVQFWGQYPSGKNWIAGLCNAYEYGHKDVKWRYLTFSEASFGETQSVSYLFSPGTVSISAGLETKAPSDDKILTASASGNPPFTYAFNDKAAGIKKVTLDYATWKVTVDATTAMDIKVDASGVATLVAPADLTVPAGVKAYTLSYADEVLNATEVENTIPANTPVVIKGEEGTYSFAIGENLDIQTDLYNDNPYNIDVTTEGNALIGVMQPHYVPVNAYVLQNDEDGVAFVTVGETANQKINNHRCYVLLPETAAEKVSMKFPEGTTTGITSYENDNENNVMFNLAGQRVNANAKGIIIKNNKKYINK